MLHHELIYMYGFDYSYDNFNLSLLSEHLPLDAAITPLEGKLLKLYIALSSVTVIARGL